MWIIRLPMSLPPCYKSLDSAFEDNPLQEYLVLAFKALDSNIGTQPHHLPFIAAAGVLLFESDYVSQPEFQYHTLFYSKVSRD